MAIYLNFNNLSVKGNVTAEGYKDWIRLDGFEFGVSRHITMEAGHMSNREATRPSLSTLSIQKLMDSASSGLFKESLTGDAGVKAVIDVVRTAADKIEKFATYELEDVIISKYTVSAGGDSAPTESLSLSYSKLTMSYIAADRANKGASPERVGYDLEAGKKL
ncbi:type VI secretion system tube protein Hcp [Hahella ganghwensis]|uniref:type VI secretion system tube protein Hcp n=1 Tax=Hahella ganghwensis TaxID=286420 RepID=UPI0003A96397